MRLASFLWHALATTRRGEASAGKESACEESAGEESAGEEMAADAGEVTSWQHLPPDIQQRTLMFARPCVRCVCKAARDAFDAVNTRLKVPWAYGPHRLAVARAAVLRAVQRSPSLTSMSLPQECRCVTFSDLTAAAGEDLPLRVTTITGLHLDGPHVLKQLQALQQFTGLVHLDISYSAVSEWGFKQRRQGAAALSAVLSKLIHLVHLNANDCALGSEGAEELATALPSLTQLQYLYLADNFFGAAGLRALAAGLCDVTGLQTLAISHNICMGGLGAEALCEVLHNTPGLTYLDATWNTLEPEGAVVLAPVLQRMTSLRHVHLQGNSFGDEGVAALAPALAALPMLYSLVLRYNQLGEGAMEALQPVFAREGSPLRVLDLGTDPLGTRGAQALALSLPSASQLQSLTLFSAELGTEGVTALAPALTTLAPTLQLLQLGDIGKGCAVVSALAPALQALTGLTHLQISCSLEAEGMALVVPALMGMRRLQTLDLSESKMGPGGAAALAQVLPALAGSLQRLDLGGCNVGSQGAAALAPALAQTTALFELRLHNNDLGPEAGEVLAPALEALPLLFALWVHHNKKLAGRGHLAIARALQGRETMPTVYFSPSSARSGRGWKELQAILDVNMLVGV